MSASLKTRQQMGSAAFSVPFFGPAFVLSLEGELCKESIWHQTKHHLYKLVMENKDYTSPPNIYKALAPPPWEEKLHHTFIILATRMWRRFCRKSLNLLKWRTTKQPISQSVVWDVLLYCIKVNEKIYGTPWNFVYSPISLTHSAMRAPSPSPPPVCRQMQLQNVLSLLCAKYSRIFCNTCA